jgi:hypothetical protein
VYINHTSVIFNKIFFETKILICVALLWKKMHWVNNKCMLIICKLDERYSESS